MSSELGELDEWRRWTLEIPFIQFPASWKVQVVPPSVGAIVRFRVWLPSLPEGDSVSEYLDCYNRLGFYTTPDLKPIPYWEVYPYQGDVGRCDMEDVDKLIELIADRSERSETEETENV